MKQNIFKLLEFLYEEVKSAGGDGDAMWFVKYFSLNEVETKVKEYNSCLQFKWKVERVNEHTILWHDNQESVIITDSVELWNGRPAWHQVAISW